MRRSRLRRSRLRRCLHACTEPECCRLYRGWAGSENTHAGPLCARYSMAGHTPSQAQLLSFPRCHTLCVHLLHSGRELILTDRSCLPFLRCLLPHCHTHICGCACVACMRYMCARPHAFSSARPAATCLLLDACDGSRFFWRHLSYPPVQHPLVTTGSRRSWKSRS